MMLANQLLYLQEFPIEAIPISIRTLSKESLSNSSSKISEKIGPGPKFSVEQNFHDSTFCFVCMCNGKRAEDVFRT